MDVSVEVVEVLEDEVVVASWLVVDDVEEVVVSSLLVGSAEVVDVVVAVVVDELLVSSLPPPLGELSQEPDLIMNDLLWIESPLLSVTVSWAEKGPRFDDAMDTEVPDVCSL